MKVDREKIRILHSPQESIEAVTHLSKGEKLSFVWELTVEIYSLSGDFDAKSRLQRNIVHFTKQ